MINRLVIGFIAVLSVSGPVHAVNFYCDGQVSSVGMGSGAGSLYVSYGSVGFHTICNVSATLNGIQAATCRAWMAVLMTAQAQQKAVRLYYDSATPGNPTSCSGLQAWTGYAPYFVQMID